MACSEIPRRCYLDKLTPTERLIKDLVPVVESLGAHPHLTATVIKLQEAANSLADFVDGIPFVEPKFG